MLSQIVVKSVHLTGRTGEQHRPPSIQLLPHLLIDAGDVALNGLGSPDAGQVLLALYRFMADPQLGVHPGTEHHAAALQHIVRQQGEYTPAGGVLPHGIVGVPCGKDRRLRMGLPLAQHRADVGAMAALDAGVRHRGVEEALPVGQHMDGIFGAALGAGGAAGALTARG